jgi:predicted DNA-binding mobile mystery protein A
MPTPEKDTSPELATVMDRTLPIGQVVRPAAGWLRTVRDSLGLTLADLARRLNVTPPAVRAFEKAEAEDRITLASLRRVAVAMECDLVYALVPRSGAARPVIETEPRPEPVASPPTDSSPAKIPAADDVTSKKVTDLTWHTLHGDP